MWSVYPSAQGRIVWMNRFWSCYKGMRTITLSGSKTARAVSDMEIDGIKIHLLYVVRGTTLDKLYAAGEYRCLEQQEYADLVCDFLEHIPKNMVIQRLTGDPHPEELVAPMWALKKTENIALIKKTLEKRDAWQGKFATN